MDHSPSCFTAQISPSQVKQLQETLPEQGFELFSVAYAHFAARKKGISCIAYRSGTLTVQGKDKDPFILYFLEPQILQTFTYHQPVAKATPDPHIGIDEAGKGDFFGPLCIAALYADREGIAKLLSLNIRESKKTDDSKVLRQAKQLRTLFPYKLLTLAPPTYNALYPKFANLNHLLAWGHATAARDLIQKTGCRQVLVDQFSSNMLVKKALERSTTQPLVVTERPHAEEDLVVAAASLLARAAYLEQLRALQDHHQLLLPKGASAQVVATGKQLVAKHGPHFLEQVAKLHFKTRQQILA